MFDLVGGPHGVPVPVAVAARLGAGRLEPVAGEVVDDSRILEPPDLIVLVAQRAADGSVRAGPERPVRELREHVAGFRRAVGEVLGQELPAVVVGGVDLLVRRVEERDPLLVPVPVAVIPPVVAGENLLWFEEDGAARRVLPATVGTAAPADANSREDDSHCG